MKQCIKCEQMKDKNCFSKHKMNKDGLQYVCKSCVKIYHQEHKENRVAYYQVHKKEIGAYYQVYNQKNYLRKTWYDMIRRCYVSKCKDYKNYGGRGITVCQRWLNSFEAFKEDIGERPSPKHSIDRINNNGNYGPSNVKWSTIKEQSINKGGH
ncbi:hypothetical protein LCGC14_0865180 [marine sediment metagenome]|uniref:Uncharacterized protein n=1 Tax=marine sediment metagenome TaxID=412755 RepID=A0A0F9P6A6_9ZZZZ